MVVGVGVGVGCGVRVGTVVAVAGGRCALDDAGVGTIVRVGAGSNVGSDV